MKVVLCRLRSTAADLFRDESGQSTTEYVLLLLVVAVAVKAVGSQLQSELKKILSAAFTRTASEIEE